jgi:hypothetical protein
MWLFLRSWFRFKFLKPICVQHPLGNFPIYMRGDFLVERTDKRPVFELAPSRPGWGQIVL